MEYGIELQIQDLKINHKPQLKKDFKDRQNSSVTPAGDPWTMQFGVHLEILQILDISYMQCPKLTNHLVQEGICTITKKIIK